jgi:hypothetical protein
MFRRAYKEGLAKAAIGKKYDLDTEENYLRYYIKHFDLITLMVLFSVMLGYIRGKVNTVIHVIL